MYQEEEGQQNIIQQEQMYILKFQTLINTQEEVNEWIKNKLEPIKNAFQNQSPEEYILEEVVGAPRFNPDVYKNLQLYIDAHKNDEIAQNQPQQDQAFSFQKNLENLISERDYEIMHTLKRQQLQDLACLAEFLMYDDLVKLIMNIILFYLAGTHGRTKNKQQVGYNNSETHYNNLLNIKKNNSIEQYSEFFLKL